MTRLNAPTASTSFLFTQAKEKASKANAKQAGVGVGFPCQVSVFAGVQFSPDFMRAFNDRIKHEYEKIAGCEKSHSQSYPHTHQINKNNCRLG